MSPSEYLPLTSMQQGMIYHALTKPESSADIEQVVINVDEAIDAQAFIKAWQTTFTRNPHLRTGFEWLGLPAPRQKIQLDAKLSIECMDWRSHATISAAITEFCSQDREQTFDLSQAPLMRLGLIQTADDHWVTVWTFHHILLDSRAQALVLREVFYRYSNDAPSLTPLRSFSQFVEWWQAQDLSPSQEYWTRTLENCRGPSPLPWSPGGEKLTQTIRRANRHLDAATTQSLERLIESTDSSWPALVEAAWALLLWRHTGETQVAYGAVVSARDKDLEGANNILGLMANTVPRVLQIDANQSVKQFLSETEDSHKQALKHQFLGLADIQRAANKSTNTPASGLFDSLVIYESESLDAATASAKPSQAWWLQSLRCTGYPLALYATKAAQLELELEFDASRFDADTVSDLLDRLVVLLNSMAKSGGTLALNELAWLTERDCQDVLQNWNATEQAQGPYTCVYDALVAHAQAQPESEAIRFLDEVITYRQLLNEVDTAAARMQKAGLRPGERVALTMARSQRMVVAMLAVHRAGAAYIPCDPTYPAERLSLLWAESGACLVVTEQAVANTLPVADIGLFLMDDPKTGSPQQPTPVKIEGEMPAYVIFTSGSTGKPKGVVIRHANLMNLMQSMALEPGLSQSQRMLALTRLSFDMSVPEPYLPLTVGACMVIAEEDDALDGARIQALISRHNINMMQATPATYRLLNAAGWRVPANFKGLIGGEAVDAALATKLRENAESGFELWNMYGPTETTVWSTCEQITTGTVCIGKPMANTQCWVLDSDLRPVAPGVSGELLIGGAGVALGYLNQPELTAEKFIDFQVTPEDVSQRVYRTGDRVRWRREADASGRLDYIERIDFQVKLRGFRIELGEIESRLIQHPAVTQAVVVLRNEGGDRLVAYVVADADVDHSELRAYLAEHLPAYMLPGAFVSLEIFPLNANGKIDRRALPQPKGRVETGKRYIAPRNPTEREVATIWSEILGVQEPGIDDTFNALGGDSLRLVAVLGRLQGRFDTPLKVADLFRHATIAQLAEFLDGQNRQGEAIDTNALDARVQKRRAALKRRRPG